MTIQPRCLEIKDWDRVFDALERTTVLDEIRREVYPDDYADGLKALSMVMGSELRWCAEALQLEPGSVFVDLGCGLGGPGQWLANATSTAVIGVDISHAALQHARRRSLASAGMRGARYLAADAIRFPFRGGCFRGALAVDVLQCLPDTSAALAALARTLQPGARLAASTRELRSAGSGDLPIQILADHEPLLRAAGFDLLRREEPPGWEKWHRAYYTRILDRRDHIAMRAGTEFRRAMVRDAENVLSILGATRRVLLVAERTMPPPTEVQVLHPA
jgi:ubiquinone/menaquinone biosynthesis C-methylase UbiE